MRLRDEPAPLLYFSDNLLYCIGARVKTQTYGSSLKVARNSCKFGSHKGHREHFRSSSLTQAYCRSVGTFQAGRRNR